MSKFLERQKVPKLTHEEIENLNRPITVKRSNQFKKNKIKHKNPNIFVKRKTQA